MDTVRLNNGLKMPPVGFGTWQIWLNGSARNAVAEALKTGYRLIDTARLYRNEKGVGRAVKASDIKRQEIIVTTKLWNNDHGYYNALGAFDDSLKRLGLDYIDLYLIHFPRAGQLLETWRALEEIYKSGRAKAIGISNYEMEHIQEIIDAGATLPAVNQIELHIFNYAAQRQLVEFCQHKGITVEAYSPLAQASQMNNPVIVKVAEKYQKTYAQIMLRWCVQHGTVPIPKSSNSGRIRENFDVFDFEIASKDMQALDALS